MARITNKVRGAIVVNALSKAGILEERDALRLRRAAFAEACRVKALGGLKALKSLTEWQTALETLKAAHPGVSSRCTLRTDTVIRINVAGHSRDMVWFSGEFHTRDDYFSLDSVSKVTPQELVIPAGDPLETEWKELDEACEALYARIKEISTSVRAVLASVTTDKQLLALWPEAAVLLPPKSTSICTAITVPAASLNALVGLP